MRVVGVLDLLAGRAVHARAGRRESYAPVCSVAGASIAPGDAVALARVYVDRLGLVELYAADLDAIIGRLQSRAAAPASLDVTTPDAQSDQLPNPAVLTALTTLGKPVWLDAGVASVSDARRAFTLGITHIVVGLETLPSYGALHEICAAVGRAQVAFSLDLRDGEPIVTSMAADSRAPAEPADRVAARAADAGASAIIVIDLARVGTGAGLDLGLIARVREAVPTVTLLAGGGVRGLEDLVQLRRAGCDGAVVATALLDGRLGAADVAAARAL